MIQMLINAYLELSEEAPALSGEEWRENRERRKRIGIRAKQQYGKTIQELINPTVH